MQVLFAVQDGRLGILPPQDNAPLLVVGKCSGALAANTPVVFTRPKDLVAQAGYGDAVDAAAAACGKGRRVILVNTGGSTAGTNSVVGVTGWTGTSTPTVSGVSAVTADIALKILIGGTQGVAGVFYAVSRDGGRNYDPPKALGTATSITVDASGLVFNLGAGTLIAGNVATVSSKAPEPNDAELLAALNAAHASNVPWELGLVVGTASATSFDIVHTFADTATNQGRPCSFFLCVRMPNVGESDSTYQASISPIFVGTKTSTYIELTAGDCRMTSQVEGSDRRAPFGWELAVMTHGLEPHISASAPVLGGLPIRIRDANGNPLHHDEGVTPGLSEGMARFSVARTYLEVGGVHSNRAQLFSAQGSDFDLHAHRRVMNRALRTIYVPLVLRLHQPIPVYKTTGKIVESEAKEIESAIQNLLESVLLGRPMASAVIFALSREDNILSTKTLSADLAVIPLGYPDIIRVSVGFRNPALEVRAQ